MWKASEITYEKHVQHTDRNNKYYCAVLFNVDTQKQRFSSAHFKTATAVLTYARKFNERQARELHRERKPELVGKSVQPNVLQKVIKTVYTLLAPRAVGVDVSHHDGYFDPDKAAKPIDFAAMKLTEGTTFVDNKADIIWQGVKKVPVRGGYHYQRSGMSWLLQANHYLDVARAYDLHFHVLDLESYGNTYSNSFFADARRILDYWQANTQKRVVLYTNISTYEAFAASIINQYSDGQTWLNDLALWIAFPSLTVLNPALPKGRSTWSIWQYRWDGAPTDYGTQAYCDVNVFNGSISQLQAWVGGVEPIPPVEEPPTTPGDPPMTTTTVTKYFCTTDTYLCKKADGSGHLSTIKKGTEIFPIQKLSATYQVSGGYIKIRDVRTETVTVEVPDTNPPPPAPDPAIEYLLGYDANDNQVARFNKA